MRGCGYARLPTYIVHTYMYMYINTDIYMYMYMYHLLPSLSIVLRWNVVLSLRGFFIFEQ